MLQQLEQNTTGYYQIGIGIQYYLPVMVGYRSALIVTAAHSNFFKNQNWSMRFWFSRVPNDISISGVSQPQLAYVDPLKEPVRFGLYDFDQEKPQLDRVQWVWPVVTDTRYYLNIQNRETKANGFYLTIDTVSF